MCPSKFAKIVTLSRSIFLLFSLSVITELLAFIMSFWRLLSLNVIISYFLFISSRSFKFNNLHASYIASSSYVKSNSILSETTILEFNTSLYSSSVISPASSINFATKFLRSLQLSLLLRGEYFAGDFIRPAKQQLSFSVKSFADLLK